MLPEALAAAQSSSPNGPKVLKYPILETSLEFIAALVADLVHARKFAVQALWTRCVGLYLSVWVDEAKSAAFTEAVLGHYKAIDKVRLFICRSSDCELELIFIR